MRFQVFTNLPFPLKYPQQCRRTVNALSTPATTTFPLRRVNHCISTSMFPVFVLDRSISPNRKAFPLNKYFCSAKVLSITPIFSKYLSEYQPLRIRLMSILKTSFVSRVRLKIVMSNQYQFTASGSGTHSTSKTQTSLLTVLNIKFIFKI